MKSAHSSRMRFFTFAGLKSSASLLVVAAIPLPEIDPHWLDRDPART